MRSRPIWPWTAAATEWTAMASLLRLRFEDDGGEIGLDRLRRRKAHLLRFQSGAAATKERTCRLPCLAGWRGGSDQEEESQSRERP